MSRRSWSCSSSLSMPIDTMIGVSTLLRSCAMPPASVPMLSRRCARRNCCSSFVRSVMSVLMTSTADGAAGLVLDQRPAALDDHGAARPCRSAAARPPSRPARGPSAWPRRTPAGSDWRSRATVPMHFRGGPAVEALRALVPVGDAVRRGRGRRSRPAPCRAATPARPGGRGPRSGRSSSARACTTVRFLPLQRRDEQDGEKRHHAR